MDGESIRLVERSWGETKCECCPPVSVWYRATVHQHRLPQLQLKRLFHYSFSMVLFFTPGKTGDVRPEGSNMFVFNCSGVH